jgi:hypothetical protein
MPAPGRPDKAAERSRGRPVHGKADERRKAERDDTPERKSRSCASQSGSRSRKEACGPRNQGHSENAQVSGNLDCPPELRVRLSDQGEDQGRIVLVSDAGTEDIISEAIAGTVRAHKEDVEHAVALFRSRSRDLPTMRSAIVCLAGVLEAERDLLKVELLSKDSGALFDIANNFDLRHRKADQKTDYDPAFLEWLFDWYLSTVNLVRKLQPETG